MKLAITQEDIDNAGDDDCPVEEALWRQTGYRWEVGMTSAYCAALRKTIRLPKQVTALLGRFDRGEPVEPMEFETVEP